VGHALIRGIITGRDRESVQNVMAMGRKNITANNAMMERLNVAIAKVRVLCDCDLIYNIYCPY